MSFYEYLRACPSSFMPLSECCFLALSIVPIVTNLVTRISVTDESHLRCNVDHLYRVEAI